MAEVCGYDQPMTFREYCLWRAFRIEDLSNPDRNDYYLMRLIQKVDGIFGKAKGDLNHYKIPFKSKEKHIPTPEEATRWSRINLGLDR